MPLKVSYHHKFRNIGDIPFALHYGDIRIISAHAKCPPDDVDTSYKLSKNCGFVTYDLDKRPMKFDELYSKTREQISYGNIVTTNRKIEYHKNFLSEIVNFHEDLIDNAKRIFDIGCGTAGFLNYLKKTYGYINVQGTEYSESMRIFAKNEYGLDIKKEISELEGKADFIMLYHTLEHIP